MASPDFQYRFARTSMQRANVRKGFWQTVNLDPWLMLFLTILTGMGLLILYSASGSDLVRVERQAISFLLAYTLLIVMAQIPPGFYKLISPFIYVVGLLLLVAVMLFGEVRMGAQRWIRVPGIGSMQPSEFMKLGMPMMLAWFLSIRTLPPSITTIAFTLIMMLVPILLIAEQPDLGTSLLVLSSGLFVLFLAGLSWRLIFGAVFAVAAFIPIAWKFLLHDYQRGRVMTLLNPEADILGAGWNIMQSKTAIGSGGLSGKGYFEGTQSHLHFLPEGHTDFVIAAFSEEFGFLGVLILMALYIALVVRCMQIALMSRLTYNRLLAGAIGMSFFVYVFVNMGMVSGILPVVGVPLPFVSYGGTAVIILMAGFGLVMSVYGHRR